jgi:Tfp pilus assembly protein PilF
MTLVQVLANETSLHMCCDFRLTDPWTGELKSNTAHKLVTLQMAPVAAIIGVTGIAFLDGKPVGDWIAEVTARLGPGSSAEDIADALRQAENVLSRLQGAHDRRLTFVVGAIVGSQSLVSLVSNFEEFVDGRIVRAGVASAVMTISSVKPKSESFFATGDASSIKLQEREHLILLLRSGAGDAQIQKQLRQVNEAVSTRTETVSAGCYAGSLHTTGAGSGRPFLTDEQPGDFISPGFAHMMKRAGIQLNRATGPDGRPLAIREDSATFATSGASPQYFREQLKLRPDSAEVWNNYGSFLNGRRKFDEAIDAFEKACTLDPAYPTALANLARSLWLHRGDVARADSLYAKAVEVEEPSVSSWILSDYAVFCDEGLADPVRASDLHGRAAQDQNYVLATARQALFMLKYQQDPEKAKELLAAALNNQPNSPQILLLAGQADFFYLKDPEAASEKLHKACSLDPSNVYGLRLAADVCLSLGDSASAAYYYRKLIKRQKPTAEVHGNYGLALLLEGKLDGALRHLSNAAHSAPNNLNIRTNLAAALWISRKRDDAVALMNTIMDSQPPPHIELEVVAMLYVTGSSPPGATTSRMRELIAAGARADGNTVRCLVRNRPRSERQAGEQVARIIEAKLAIPSDW